MTTLWNNLDANAKGEYLRKQFFLCNNEHDIGCYSSFVLASGVKRLPDEPDEEYSEYIWTCAENTVPEVCSGKIVMKYNWDGDGALEFYLPNGTILANTDCKKTLGWREYKKCTYTQEEVQALLTRAFELGGNWQVDRGFRGAVKDELKKFKEETGFTLK
jgi:hypothetical protein